MISKLDDIEISQEEPFANCKLGRKKNAEILTQIVSLYNSGSVLAINGEWGTGKTTFVKMWQQHLNNNGFNTLYFNVWENDFISDPLIGLIGEFKELSTKYKLEHELSKVTTTAGKIVLSMLPTLVEAIAKKYLGKDTVEAFKGGARGVADILDKEIQNFEEQKCSIKEFRNALIDLINNCNSDKPLIFIVDELNRCNPAYAVKVLERIKHLFSIPNIVFVLSIDKKQLCNSVKGYYGSESLDAENYLKRFIDIEYNLPEPNYKEFCGYLYSKFEIKYNLVNVFHNTDYFNEIASMLFKQNQLSLRQMEKIYSHAGLALNCNKQCSCSSELFLILIFFRVCFDDIYYSLKHGEYKNPQEIIDVIEPFIPSLDTAHYKTVFNYAISYLICVYFAKFGYIEIHRLLRKEIDNTDFIDFNVTRLSGSIITEAIKRYSETAVYLDSVFDSATDLIDLLNNFR